MARARRGSIARAIAPEAAVRVAHKAAAWRPRGRVAPRREDQPSDFDPISSVLAEAAYLKATTLKLG